MASSPPFLHYRHALPLAMRSQLCRFQPFLGFRERGFLRIASSPPYLKHPPVHAQQTDHDTADSETVEWVNTAVRDPMVEVDPVTITNQILAQKESRRLQESISLAEESFPALSQSSKRLSNATIASVGALILLIVAVTPLILKFRERFGRLPRPMIASTSEPLKAKREVVKGTIKASHDAIPVTANKKVEPVALGTRPSSHHQNHKNLRTPENAVTKQRPYYKELVVESGAHNGANQLSTNNQIQQMTHTITRPSLEQKIQEIPENKDFTDNAPYKANDEEVDAMGGQRLKQLMDQNLSHNQSAHAESGVVLDAPSFQTFVKAGQSYSGKHTSDSIQEQKQFITEKAPVKLALQDSIAFLSSSSVLHSNANSSTEPLAYSLSSSDFQTSTKTFIQTKQLSIAYESEMSASESLEKETEKISKGDRKAFNKALEAVLPAVTIGIGTLGALVGASAALQVIGFAATARLISRDLFWAQTREELWQELSSITDRQKLLDFLMKRNIVKKST